MPEPTREITLEYLDENDRWKWEVTMLKDNQQVYIAHYIGKRQAISAYKTLCEKYGIEPNLKRFK